MRPHLTTFVACWSWPTSEMILCLVALFLVSYFSRVSCILVIFSSQSLISIQCVSIIIPKKESEVVGQFFRKPGGYQDQNTNKGGSPGSAGRWVIVVGLQVGNHQGSEGCIKFPIQETKSAKLLNNLEAERRPKSKQLSTYTCLSH